MKPQLVFAELIDELRRAGFSVGTSHYLRLQELLPHVAALPPEQLRMVLCPLFARNADEQARFHRAYDDFLARRLRVARPGVQRIAAGATPPGRHRWTWKAAAILAAALVLAVLLFRPGSPPADEQGTETTGTAHVVVPAAEAMPRPALRTSVDRALELIARHPVLAGLSVLLLIALLAETWRSFHRLLSRRRHEGSGRPFVWPLHADEGGAAEPFASRAFEDAARLLRGREASGQQRLDVPRTVRESIRALGHIVPVYREGQRAPEYLLLIERRSARDHLAAYFEAFGDALARAGVHVERAFFGSDPRRVAAELRHRFPEHRLLLCAGSPSMLLDPLTGEPAPWVDAALPWQQRGVVTAGDLAYAAPLRRLQFAVGDASAEGLRELAESWPQAELEPRRARATLPAVASDPSLDDVRAMLSPRAWESLVRCAAHATLEWPLTCALLPRDVEAGEAERVLLELSRLAWFREGAIPPHVRAALVRELEERDDAAAAREIVMFVLDHAPPPRGSTAARAREVATVTQRMFLDRRVPAGFKRAARLLRRYPLSMIGADVPLVRLLRSAPATRFWRRSPRWLRRAVFPLAAPALGARPFAYVLPLVALAVVLFVAGLPAPPPPAPVLGGGGTGGGGGGSDFLPPAPAPPRVDTSEAGPAVPDDSEPQVTDTMTTITTTSTTVATDSDPAPRIFRGEEFFSPSVVPPPATESVAPSSLADRSPAPVLKNPVGRAPVRIGTSGPILFIWSPRGTYELVIWKDAPGGEPLFQTPVRGAERYKWRPDALDPSATYYWTLRALHVPSTLEPQSFVLSHVPESELPALDDADQRARSREIVEDRYYDLPCTGNEMGLDAASGIDTVPFSLGPNEVIFAAEAAVIPGILNVLAEKRVSATPFGNSVKVDYYLRLNRGPCTVPMRAHVRVTAVIGPRIHGSNPGS